MSTETAPARAGATIDSALVARLTSRVAASGGTVTTIAPFTGEPLAKLPVSSPDDVAAAYERGARGAAQLGAPSPERTGTAVPAAARPGTRAAAGDPRHPATGNRQGPLGRVRGGHRRCGLLALLREARAGPAAPAAARWRPARLPPG